MKQPIANPQPETESEPVLPPETEASESSSTKRVRGNAIHRLAKAYSKQVLLHSDEIATALCERAKTGDISSVKLLLHLIEKLPPPRERSYKSMALLLKNSPPWEGEPYMPKHDEEDDEEYNDD